MTYQCTRKFVIELSDSGLLENHLREASVIAVHQHTVNASEDKRVPNALEENGLMWIVNSAWNNVVLTTEELSENFLM